MDKRLTDEEIDAIQEAAYLQLRTQGYNGGMGGETWDRASARAVEAALLEHIAQRPTSEAKAVHPNHRPDLRYIKRVLEGVQVPAHQQGDVEAAITGMRYIIERTEAAAPSPQAAPTPELPRGELTEEQWREAEAEAARVAAPAAEGQTLVAPAIPGVRGPRPFVTPSAPAPGRSWVSGFIEFLRDKGYTPDEIAAELSANGLDGIADAEGLTLAASPTPAAPAAPEGGAPVEAPLGCDWRGNTPSVHPCCATDTTDGVPASPTDAQLAQGAFYPQVSGYGTPSDAGYTTGAGGVVQPQVEPVAWLAEDNTGYRGLTFISPQTAEGAWDGFTITPLYAAPPEALLRQAVEALETCATGGYRDVDGDWCVTHWYDKAKVDAAIAALQEPRA